MLNTQQPRYLAIAATIRKKIKEGGFSSDSALPSQKELSHIFRASVMTVRQALSVLEKEGLIVFEHGVGTFVAPGRLEDGDFRLQGFQDEMGKSETGISTKILEKQFSIINARVAQLFGVKEDHLLCLLVRIRSLGQVPIILQRSFVPEEFAETIKSYSENQSLYGCLGKEAGQIIIRGREIIRPVSLKKNEASVLNRPQGTPALLSYRLSLDLSDRAVLFDEAYLAGDRVALSAFRVGRQCKFHYNVAIEEQADPWKQLLTPELWEEW